MTWANDHVGTNLSCDQETQNWNSTCFVYSSNEVHPILALLNVITQWLICSVLFYLTYWDTVASPIGAAHSLYTFYITYAATIFYKRAKQWFLQVRQAVIFYHVKQCYSTYVPISDIQPTCQAVLFYERAKQWYSTNVPGSDILPMCRAVIFYERAKQCYSTNVPSSDILQTCQAAVIFYEHTKQWYPLQLFYRAKVCWSVH